jgi:flagellar biosynthetic protein FliQ
MTVELVTGVLTDMFMTGLLILLPILGASLVFGLIISIFQAATSIQEMTLTFVPKIIITAVVIILLLPFIVEKLMSLAYKYINMISTAIQ